MQDKTPLMQQYDSIKEQHQDALLFFQVGDFYELFYQDAERASKVLGITLTSRGKSRNGTVPLCGVPVHTVDFYLKKLIEHGFKVALCNQLTEAQPGIISERGVVRVFTPGTIIDSFLLSEKSPSYLAALCKNDSFYAFAAVELLTGVIQCTLFPVTAKKSLDAELARFAPDEVIVQEHLEEEIRSIRQQHFFVSSFSKTLSPESVSFAEWFSKQQVTFKMQQERLVIQVLEQLYVYLSHVNKNSLTQLYVVNYYEAEDYVILDAETVRNLAIVSKNKQDTGTLFHVLNNCMTPMGARLLKKWLLFPLKHRAHIEKRLRLVHYFFTHYALFSKVRSLLSSVGDFERLVGRISLRAGSISDYRLLTEVLSHTQQFFDYIESIAVAELVISATKITECRSLKTLREFLCLSLCQDNVLQHIIKDGFNKELDELRSFSHNMRKNLLEFENMEQQKTGVASLKIRSTSIHGYYIEITKTHLHKVPASYTRLQTLSGKERYTNESLQMHAHKIEHATTQVTLLEKELFEEVKQQVDTYLPLLKQTAFLFSYFDVITTFCFNAYEYGYSQPQLQDDGVIEIIGGRHPIIERLLQKKFVSNDTQLSDTSYLMILTGPNMGGKSTYLRQVALICILVHIGSFVPAKSAKIMLLDRIFTRIGAGDNLAEGKSTFLVEMEEVSTICAYATNRSLLILDEVGRGTGTKDGVALAQAILEYLCDVIKARCLFATHYQELALLATKNSFMKSYCVESRKIDDKIVFLYTISQGIAESSFGIEVAKMAQLPALVIKRALDLLKNSDITHEKSVSHEKNSIKLHEDRVRFLEEKCQILENVDINELTPKQALDLLFRFKSVK